MSDPFVVKVQKSIAGNQGRTMLIYDYSRSVYYESALTRKLDKEIPDLKQYWWATLRDDGMIELQGRPIDDVGVRGETPEEQFELYDFKTMNSEGKG